VCIGTILSEWRFGAELAALGPARIVAAMAPGKYLGRGSFYYQRSDGQCGPASLANILLLLGVTGTDFDTLLERFGDVTTGVSIAELKAVGDQVGLRGTLLTVDPNVDLRDLVPSIMFVNGDHFVVLKRCIADNYIVVDPALGIFELSNSELSRMWSGVALHFEKSCLQ